MVDPQKVVGESNTAAALQAGIALANAQGNPHPHGDAFVLVPEGYNLEYVKHPAIPPRRAGTVKLADAASFLEYWKRQSDTGSYIYGSMSPAQFIAVLNEHSRPGAPMPSASVRQGPFPESAKQSIDGPNWRDHRALYTLAHSDEWMAWKARSGQPFEGNEQFAYWLEENVLDIVKPEPAKFMDIILNFKVRQGQAFGNKVNLHDGNMVVEYTNQVEGGAGQSGKVAIPQEFTIKIPVFKGLIEPKYEVGARFRYRLQNGGLTLRYDLIRPAKVMEQAFKDMLAEIQKASKTTVLFGSPE